ncbi:MAG: class I SAM-dependent methyltransferase [Bacteroidales bacterium]|nr:class I SAM-dependent methyltransferase [Bacteroidales bacterium]
METLTTPLIEEYCEAHTSSEGELLYRLFRETNLRMVKPRMLSGQLQGRFLSMISRMVRPAHALEIGTFTGYSALCLAEGLAPDGILDTIEIEEEMEETILRYVGLSPYKERIHLHIGDARQLIPQFDCLWDLVFIDAEKRSNREFYDLLLPRMRKGGLMLIDNMLWSGKVVEQEGHHDLDTQAIMEFNDYVQRDERVSNVLLPLRDGIMMVMC